MNDTPDSYKEKDISSGEKNHLASNVLLNFRAETEALCEAALAVSRHPERTTGKVVLLSDALSALLALRNSRNKELNHLCQALISLSSAVQQVVLQMGASTLRYQGERESRHISQGRSPEGADRQPDVL